ncbi:Aste57867_5803 [Aphanomyces stellatus]|uniref:Aste57867_5803 protein n=2 Tax=Aphanomyces stellatus TaxID=120398 RepID=A0A485KHI6_9STRA|nr:hypothetical protein As57867_005789 [Aphanomyces stellatus]VFT82826.1 Aste57867_5803 [Aphanomyces stellatus]
MALLTTLGHHLHGWNAGWTAGFVPFCVAQVIMAAAYTVHISTLAEIGAKVPGGSYGFARAVLGFYTGFLVAALELIQYITQTALAVLLVGHLVAPRGFQPLVWAVVYAGVVALHQLRGKLLMQTMLIAVVLGGLLPVGLFLVGSLPHTNFAKHAVWVDNDANTSVWATGSTAFIASLPYTTYAYSGIESISIVTNFARDPVHTIPRGSVYAVWTLVAVNMVMVFVVASLPHGISTSVEDEYLTNRGFQLALGISANVAPYLILPSQCCISFGFMMPIAKLTQAMADSNLLPSCLRLKSQPTSFRAIVVASVIGYGLCLVAFLSPPAFQSNMRNVAILCAVVCNVTLGHGFILLRTTFFVDSMSYDSPFGHIGVYFTWFTFCVLAISVFGGFQGDDGLAAGSFVGLVLLLSLYYLRLAKGVQTVSAEENASNFKFSIMKFNKRKKPNKKKYKKFTSSHASSVAPSKKSVVKSTAPGEGPLLFEY